MIIKELADAVLAELKRLGYKQITIHNYERIYADLIQFANDKEVTEYSTELSVKYLKEKLGIDLFHVTSGEYDKNSYFPIRACQCLTEWKLHKYIPLKKQGKLASQKMPIQFKHCFDSYTAHCKEAGYSERGTYTRLNRIKRMLIFFNAKGVNDINDLTAEDISAFFKTQIELDSRTVATLLTTIRVFFRHLYQTNITQKDYTTKLPNIKANRNFKLPKTWEKEDVLTILNSIDRGSPVGKRDYAILMLITRYGLRSSDIKDLKLSNLRWDTNTIEIIQNKTKNPLQLPLLKDVGWAIIDYLKHGRPKSDSLNVFLTCTVPYRPFGTHSPGLNAVLTKYIRSAGVKIQREVPKGVHSLRHTLASSMLSNDIPLPVISSVLGHVTQKATGHYLHIDIERLRECALDPEVLLNHDSN
ncbi:MAG: tyrosine-type recombinase/integrase [Deltaproteobacteria bacterium]|nr:tyrosine-type recombinase/integrase [Deltaproteobacteria bacterium]